MPHLVSPYLIAMGLSNHNNLHSLRAGLKSKCQLVRLSCVKCLGKKLDLSVLPTLWRMTEPNVSDIERLCASEALLRIGHFDAASTQRLVMLARVEKNPYVAKNLILALGISQPQGWIDLAKHIVRDTDHQVTLDAFVWAISSYGIINVLYRPDEPPPYYSKYYPATEWADLQDGSPSP